ncbi:MAG: polysaccharide deacetylase family protein [Candidatus Methanomethylophilaceae archaeon]|nr:polysaccharide deacetylase family protein [Candidatus Methanomethylophilaceae archaeon]
MTGRLLFTVDLDRDVNILLDGTNKAGSIDRGHGTEPRFESCEKGMDILLDILDSFGMKATFFVEGHTSEIVDCSRLKQHCIGFHGYDHEDLTMAGPEELRDIMDTGFRAVRGNVKRPTCFRAPFMRTSDAVFDELRRLGIKHDSSLYAEPGVGPYDISGITEHPVAKGKDFRGKTITAYLWPMHEGTREPTDYLSLARASGNADLVLSTHAWHMVESREKGIMTWAEMEHNRKSTEHLIKLLLDEGYVPDVIGD